MNTIETSELYAREQEKFVEKFFHNLATNTLGLQSRYLAATSKEDAMINIYQRFFTWVEKYEITNQVIFERVIDYAFYIAADAEFGDLPIPNRLTRGKKRKFMNAVIGINERLRADETLNFNIDIEKLSSYDSCLFYCSESFLVK
ncbi:MAG: hypothetical protein DI539_09500 [Flavobacterium psychrophilum]|nr:MAG: hypothetical protein DI539_09500 [Flavobacterium psychrophilum]